MFLHLSLRLRIFLLFALLALASSALAIAGVVLGYLQLGEDYALSAFVVAGFIAVLAILSLTTWVWVLFDENVAKPVERLAAEMRVRAHTEVDREFDEALTRYLGDLGPAAGAVASNLSDARNAVAEAAARETARLAVEKTRLEALLSEVPDGVLFCTAEHRLALYNGQAQAILASETGLGLNRPLGEVLRMGPVRQAYARLLAEGAERGTDILVTTRTGARLLEARLRLIQLEGQTAQAPGYLLNLRDVSSALAIHAERTHLLENLLAGARKALTKGEDPALADLIETTTAAKARTDTAWWPMEELAAEDLGAALTARLARKGVPIACDLGPARVRADGFAVTLLLERLALEWSGSGAQDLRLAAETDEKAQLVLSAPGPVPGGLERRLAQPLSPGISGFSGHDVLICHGTSLVEGEGDGRGTLTLTLDLAPAPATAPRAILYDFDLLNTVLPDSVAHAPLGVLSYVVFDTETTGLTPSQDEICQIAAMRVVHGKLVAAERFDLLVNPGRPIPAGATAIHRITDAMVADAPSVGEALTRFHAFAGGTVLVAHNAPFDMSFLRRRETGIGKRFDQPILDTVLCSAILFGQSADHTLDALCARLGITIPEAERHTALGDARVTAEAFTRMIPMLEAAGLPDLQALIGAFERHRRLIAHLN